MRAAGRRGLAIPAAAGVAGGFLVDRPGPGRPAFTTRTHVMEPGEAPATAAALYDQLSKNYQRLGADEQAKFRRLLHADRHLMREVAWYCFGLSMRARALEQRGRNRSRPPDDPKRNEAILEGWRVGKSYGSLALDHNVTQEAVIAVVKREAKKRGCKPADLRRGASKFGSVQGTGVEGSKGNGPAAS